MPRLAPTTTPAGDYVRRLREDLGLTQSAFADRLGVTQSTVSRIEGGTRPLTNDFAFRLIRHAGAEIDDLAANLPERNRDIPGELSLTSITRLFTGCRTFAARPTPQAA